MAIQLSNMAKVTLPEQHRQEVLSLYLHTARNGGVIKNYRYKDGVAYLPPSMRKLQQVALLLQETIEDIRSNGDALKAPFVPNPSFSFREHQILPAQQLLDHCRSEKYGVLHAGCGCGKTVVMTWVAGNLQTKVLILVDMGSLQSQWQEAFAMVWNKDVQIIDRKTTEFADVCVVTFQLLHLNPELLNRLRKTFGCVLLDEFHTTQSDTRRRVLFSISSQYRIGCTATLMKKGYSDDVLTDLVADISVSMEDKTELKPDVYFKPTGIRFYSNNPDDWGKIQSKLGKDEKRNQLIAETALEMIRLGRKVLIIGVTTKSLKQVYSYMILNSDCKPLLFTGSTTLEQDKQMREGVAKGTINCVMTVKKMDRGVDAPALDCLINAKPGNNEASIVQISGRVVRKTKNKPTPVIIDLVDNSTLAIAFAKNRQRWYKRLGYILKLTVSEAPDG